MNTLNSWHVKTPNGNVQGPFSDQQILKMARTGAISRADRLQHPERTKGEWVTAIGIPALGKLLPPQGGSVLPTKSTSNTDKSSKNATTSSTLDSYLPDWTQASVPVPGSVTGTVDYWAQVSQEFAASKASPNQKSVSSKSSVSSQLEKAHASVLKDEEDAKKLVAWQKGNTFYKVFAGFALSIGVLSIIGVFYWFLSENSKYVKESIVPNIEAMADRASKSHNENLNAGETLPETLEGCKLEMAEAERELRSLPPDPNSVARFDQLKRKILALAERIDRLEREKNKPNTGSREGEQRTAEVPNNLSNRSPTSRIQWSSLSGSYEIGNKSRASLAMAELKSEQTVASTTTGANTAAMDVQTVEKFNEKGFIEAQVSFEPSHSNNSQAIVFCKITQVIKTIPGRDDILTPALKPTFDDMMAKFQRGAILIVLEQNELSDIEKARAAIKQKLSNMKPSDVRDAQEIQRRLKDYK